MLTIEQVDTQSKAQVRRFVRLPFRLYAGHPQWVPPLLADAALPLDRQRHPFYEHSAADFFLAVRAGRDVGRLAVLDYQPYNHYHGTRRAQFYLFDCEDDTEAAAALFARAGEWARGRGLTQMVGPKGFGVLDGYGLLVDGFEHRAVMTMMNYNYDYYARLVEGTGFTKEVDFVSAYIHSDSFRLPERVHRIAERVQARGKLGVKRFRTRGELKAWAARIGAAYNRAFVNNWEYAPLTEREIRLLTDNLTLVADPRLIKLITHQDEVVGFLFAFPDVSAALQRARGRLWPLGLPDLLLEMRRTKWLALNGAGILPEFQGHGGNALLYAEMEHTLRDYGFEHADLTQVAESAVQMRRDLESLGGRAYKNHRVYTRAL
jgi:GNAT superfamily N-acetyltransferase